MENKDSELNGRKQFLNLNFAIFKKKNYDLSLFLDFALHFGDNVWADGRNCEVMQVFKLVLGFTVRWQNFRKASIHFPLSVLPFVCTSALNNSAPTGQNFMRFYV